MKQVIQLGPIPEESTDACLVYECGDVTTNTIKGLSADCFNRLFDKSSWTPE